MPSIIFNELYKCTQKWIQGNARVAKSKLKKRYITNLSLSREFLLSFAIALKWILKIASYYQSNLKILTVLAIPIPASVGLSSETLASVTSDEDPCVGHNKVALRFSSSDDHCDRYQVLLI